MRSPEIPPEQMEEIMRELRLTRFMIGEVAKGLGDRIAALEKAVAERMPIPSEEIEKLRETIEEVEAFRKALEISHYAIARGLPLWRAEEELAKERLWATRRAKGEVEVLETVISERNRFEFLHHRPTSQTYMEVKPIYPRPKE